jgi:hypothetical protein
VLRPAQLYINSCSPSNVLLMLQNMRGLVKEKGQTEAQLPGGMRTCHAWESEVGQQHATLHAVGATHTDSL